MRDKIEKKSGKTNRIQKNENQIRHKNETNCLEIKLKQSQIVKWGKTKQIEIKKMRVKIETKIKWNKMLRNEIERKIQQKKDWG